jgi:hypothetical protein
LNPAASVALPAWWYAANFLALEMGYARIKVMIAGEYFAGWRAKINDDHTFRLCF